jgi:hypothetical protein
MDPNSTIEGCEVLEASESFGTRHIEVSPAVAAQLEGLGTYIYTFPREIKSRRKLVGIPANL